MAQRPRVRLSKALQATLLDAIARNIPELPRTRREPSPESGDPSGDARPVQARKRRLEVTDSDPLPAKRARLEQTDDTQQPRAEDEKAEQAEQAEQVDKVWPRSSTHAYPPPTGQPTQTILQQPKPRHPYASFLGDFVDPVFPDPRLPSLHATIYEWLDSVGSDREKRCRSDSYLYHSDDHLISRQYTRSASEMDHPRDADGFAMPLTPASGGSRSHRASRSGSVATSDLTDATPDSGRSSVRSLVEDPFYRELNLAANNIHMRHPCDPIPEHLSSLIEYVRRQRDSPRPSLDEVKQDRYLYDVFLGAGEPMVEDYFKTKIFPSYTSQDVLDYATRQPMAEHTVPCTGSKLKISTPVPDMLYGYRNTAFPQQRAQLISMGHETKANTQGLMYPFLVIEFTGDGPSGSGSLWVATNQCLGGSASCVNIIERLNRQLTKCNNTKIGLVNSAAFSIAMSGTEARLYISWTHESNYHMALVRGFALYEPEQHVEFWNYVQNIIDWGRRERLKEIQDALDSLREESRHRAFEAAKARQPLSTGSAISVDKKSKCSSSRGTIKSSSGQGQSGSANEM
ncbi:hypothetical protein F5Y07DRAFT_219128 [Xylaria sp. FL0933]|nr:hypothetical protein F5Y07DRAFT_219128 [Xylaria sp. FL0933]